MEDIPGSAEQQAVLAAGGAGEQLALFHQRDPEAAQGKVVRQSASRSAADDQYVLQTRHVFQRPGRPSGRLNDGVRHRSYHVMIYRGSATVIE